MAETKSWNSYVLRTIDQRPIDVSVDRAWQTDERRLVGEVKFLLHESQLTGEDAQRAIAAYLLCPLAKDSVRARPNEVWVQGKRFLPKDFRVLVEPKPFGAVDVLFENENCGIYRERIAPGAILPTHVHHLLDEAELVLSDGLWLQGRPVAAGLAHRWPKSYPHRYENKTNIERSFICIDRPKFIPSDEVEVAVDINDLAPVPAIKYF